jgi:uncharacterized LabA/DUF88 family protein
VVSTVRSQPPMVADELRRQADVFVELADLSAEIARQHAPKPHGDAKATPTAPTPEPAAEDRGA